MTNAPTTRAAELARLAEAATPGPWRTDENSVWGACDPDDTTSRGMGISILDCRTNAPRWARADLDYRKSVDNAAFIAAANPATVLALLSEIAALRGATPHDLTMSDGTKARCSDAAWRWFQEWRVRFEHDETKRIEAERQRDEAVGLLRRWENAWRSGVSVASIIRDQAPLLANQGADQ